VPAGTVTDVFLIEPCSYADPVAAKLIAELQAEYVTRYGGPDETPVEPSEFDPPDGLFLVGSLDGDAVAGCRAKCSPNWSRRSPARAISASFL
jgi:hypothetical protein